MLFWYYLYERYHWVCVSLRQSEMRKAGLYDETEFSFRLGSRYWLEWIAFPISGVIFAALPMMVAQWSHLWTERLVYQVTAKPIKEFAKEVSDFAQTTDSAAAVQPAGMS